MVRRIFTLAALPLALLLSVAALPGRADASAAVPSSAEASASTLARDDASAAADLVRQIKDKGDRAKPDQIQELANLRTRAAFDGLVAVFDAMQTTFMKREVVRTLSVFDGIADVGQAALQKLMDIATGSPEPALRESALMTLASCPGRGKDYLKLIVNSPAEDSVREQAIKLHVRMGSKDDFAWYRELYKPKVVPKTDKEREKEEKEAKEAKKKAEKEAKEKERNKKKDAKDDAADDPKSKTVASLNSIRFTAFTAILSTLTIDEVLEATKKDPYPKISRAALEELASRGDARTLEFADAVFKNDNNLPENRVVAARIMARIEGVKAAPEFLKRATTAQSPVELRRGLAEILVGFDDPKLNKELIDELGKGSNSGEKLFQIYAVRAMKDERVDKALLKLLSDKEKDVVIAAAKILGERKSKEALAPLAKLWAKGNKERDVMRAALDATAMIRQGEQAWLDELTAMSKSDDPEMRSLALEGLANSTDKSHLSALVAALEDANWSARLVALEGLERLRMKEAIAAIITRMPKEEGRMLSEFANTLWRLTGQPYAENPEGWANWWKENGDKFQILSDADLDKVRSGEEEWKLRQTTRVETKFFGIRIISHHVIFIIDVSGSMDWGLANDYRGRHDAKRIEVARDELIKCVKGLDPAADFNIFTFSSGTTRWTESGMVPANDKNRQNAVAFIEKLKAGGGTNLYGAIEDAFKDPDVDTIFIMSDGEPSLGDEIEPLVIRENVKAWNEHRRIVINTIAIAGQFQILEWLAEDSGGTHVKFE